MTCVKKLEDAKSDLSLLCSILNDREETKIIDEGNMQEHADAVIRLAVRHNLTGSLLNFFGRYRNLVSTDSFKQLEEKCRLNAMRSLSQLGELLKLARLLHGAGIAFAVVKGPQLSRMLYGHEALKESVDLDIMLINKSDFPKTHSFLISAGYISPNYPSHKGHIFQKLFIIARREVQYLSETSGCHIDLHIKPGANTYLSEGRFRDFFDDFVPYNLEGKELLIPPPEKYFVYLCYHGALHRFSRLAWLIDIRTFLMLKNDEMNYEKLIAIACSLGVLTHVKLCFALLEKYFGDDTPELISPNLFPFRSYLVSSCNKCIDGSTDSAGSLSDRFHRFIYMMVLLKGFKAKFDFVAGVFMRAITS